MATTLGVPYRVFDLTDPGHTDLNLDGIAVLLNCAGPFVHTTEHLITACIRKGVHYLDTSAELISHSIAEREGLRAEAANVMLLPGCGGSIAMLGCLVGKTLMDMGDPQSVIAIDLVLHVSGSMSRGSAITAKEGLSSSCLQRRNGILTTQDPTCTEHFDFADGRGPVECFPITLPDLITIHKFFDVQSVRTFAHASGNAFATERLDSLPDGPSKEERDANPYHAAIAITTADGNVKRSVLHAINGYTFISIVSVEAVGRVLAGDFIPGFQTPVKVFGVDFTKSVAGIEVSSIVSVD